MIVRPRIDTVVGKPREGMTGLQTVDAAKVLFYFTLSFFSALALVMNPPLSTGRRTYAGVLIKKKKETWSQVHKYYRCPSQRANAIGLLGCIYIWTPCGSGRDLRGVVTLKRRESTKCDDVVV